MKTKAAILWGLNQPWEIEEVELDGPKRDEVTVKLVASGLCHSDHHLVTGPFLSLVATKVPESSWTSDPAATRSKSAIT